jgi:hypothetical protein
MHYSNGERAEYRSSVSLPITTTACIGSELFLQVEGDRVRLTKGQNDDTLNRSRRMWQSYHTKNLSQETIPPPSLRLHYILSSPFLDGSQHVSKSFSRKRDLLMGLYQLGSVGKTRDVGKGNKTLFAEFNDPGSYRCDCRLSLTTPISSDNPPRSCRGQNAQK